MTSPLRTLFIGVAPRTRGAHMVRIASQFGSNWFDPVAFVDATSDLAAAGATEADRPRLPCFSDLETALDSVLVDAVVITSPARFHGEQVRACLQKGLHVLVAKPMTYDLDEAVNLADLASSKGLCLLVDQQIRFQPTIRAVGDWIGENRYGSVGMIEVSMHRHRPEMRAFTGRDPYVWEQGVHTFNTLLAILDRPAVSVLAHQSAPPWTVYNGPTTVMGVIEFEGGIPCSVFGSFESRVDSVMLRFECCDAAVRLMSAPHVFQWIEVARPGEPFEAVGIDDRPGAEDEPLEVANFRNFHIGCTRGGRVPNDARDNLRTLAVVDAFVRSSQSGARELVRQFDREEAV